MSNINYELAQLRGALMSLSGRPCTLQPVEKGEAVNPMHYIGGGSIFKSSYHSWLDKETTLNQVVIPKYIDYKGTAYKIKVSGVELEDAYLTTIESPYTGLEGKVVLVTGAAQGFGFELAKHLIEAGAIVFLNDIQKEVIEKHCDHFNQERGAQSAYPVYGDVTKEDEVIDIFKNIVASVGGLDIAISNVGVLKAYSILEQPLVDFDYVTHHNYTSFMLITKYAAHIMKAQWEHSPHSFFDIVQINSKSGLTGSNKNGAYAGSKFGSLGLVQSFAMELSEYNIKVNAICPGNFLDGPLWSNPVDGLFTQYLKVNKVPGAKSISEIRKSYEEKVPLGKRGCNGLDIFKALRYIVDQCYETGQAVPVTGGQLMLN